MDEATEDDRYPIHAIKIESLVASPAVMAGGDYVTLTWATRGAKRLELWINGRPWLCPLTANGSRRIAVHDSTEFRLIAGPDAGPWIEAHATVMRISMPLFLATIVLTTAAIASLWWASQGFLSNVTLIQSTPVWRTVGATSRVASFVTTLVGVPLLGSLLRLWPGATSSFGVRLLRHRPIAAVWLLICLMAICGVTSLWSSTQTVILSSEVDATVHFLEPGKDNVALAVPPGVSTAIISADRDGFWSSVLGTGAGANVLSGGNRTLPHRVYAERQGEFWILGCWSEVLVHHPPGFQATLELADGRTVPVDLQQDPDAAQPGRLEPPHSALAVLSRRARIAVRDCKRFPTTATLVLRDSVGAEALVMPFSLSLPPEREQWARARDLGRRTVQADVEIGLVSMEHALDDPSAIAVQLFGEDGWRAVQCGRVDATVSSVLLSMATGGERFQPPLTPPGSSSEDEGATSTLLARCADPPNGPVRFAVPRLVNGQAVRSASACAFPASALDTDAPTDAVCTADTPLSWQTNFSFSLDAPLPQLGPLSVCTPQTWDGHRAQLLERQVLAPEPARPATTWRGKLAAGTHAIVWPMTHWAPGAAEIVAAGELQGAPIPLRVTPAAMPTLQDHVRIADRALELSPTPTWRDRLATPVGLVSQPEITFDTEHDDASCGWTDETEAVAERVTATVAQIAISGFPASLSEETVDAHLQLGNRRLDCYLLAGRGVMSCHR